MVNLMDGGKNITRMGTLSMKAIGKLACDTVRGNRTMAPGNQNTKESGDAEICMAKGSNIAIKDGFGTKVNGKMGRDTVMGNYM